MDIQIRNGSEKDFDTVQEIERDGARLFLTIGYDFCYEEPVRDFEELQRGVERGGLLIAEVKGRAVGSSLLWEVDGVAHLTELAVRYDYQGDGIGRSLLSASELWAQKAGYQEITLTSFRDVPWNAPFYERYGYRVINAGPERRGLLSILEDEKEEGLTVQARVTMLKIL